ncbi:hypothetical protein BDP55DRAFT_641586 [Colletotrichum godetiae]|uniref:Uncharacterized protein n=1 Tax=Colletotrichum godetiae TaxID=1209918 RepID=A0AAJ0F397_9PEZI|nr:uncharacterized protein BDP55DRAFT_641586 [Colletotrichum godetiae]KAK1701431.1 hypothetical protein BDP55DRAFT_641586 [Colletotrichum godetiae]
MMIGKESHVDRRNPTSRKESGRCLERTLISLSVSDLNATMFAKQEDDRGTLAGAPTEVDQYIPTRQNIRRTDKRSLSSLYPGLSGQLSDGKALSFLPTDVF